MPAASVPQAARKVDEDLPHREHTEEGDAGLLAEDGREEERGREHAQRALCEARTSGRGRGARRVGCGACEAAERAEKLGAADGPCDRLDVHRMDRKEQPSEQRYMPPSQSRARRPLWPELGAKLCDAVGDRRMQCNVHRMEGCWLRRVCDQRLSAEAQDGQRTVRLVRVERRQRLAPKIVGPELCERGVRRHVVIVDDCQRIIKDEVAMYRIEICSRCHRGNQ